MRFIVFDPFMDNATRERKIKHLQTKGAVVILSNFDRIGEVELGDIVIISDRWFFGRRAIWNAYSEWIFQIMENISKTNAVFIGDFADRMVVVFGRVVDELSKYKQITSMIGHWPVKEY